MPRGGALFFKLIHPLALESTSKTPPAPPGEVVSAFFCFSFLFWGAFLTRCGLLFLFGSGLCRIPRSPGFLALQHEIVVERSIGDPKNNSKYFRPVSARAGSFSAVRKWSFSPPQGGLPPAGRRILLQGGPGVIFKVVHFLEGPGVRSDTSKLENCGDTKCHPKDVSRIFTNSTNS